MRRGVGFMMLPLILLSLAAVAPVTASAADPPMVLMGILVALDRDSGALIMEHGDGTKSHLHATPTLLRGLEVGDPVQAVVEGRLVRTLSPL